MGLLNFFRGDAKNSRLRLLEEANRINDYFANAVRVFMVAGEAEARLAALTAGKVAASLQRESMVAHLRRLGARIANLDAPGEDERRHLRLWDARLTQLADELGQRDWTLMDIIAAKRELGRHDGEYLAALDNPDPDVFTRRYPELFSRETPDFLKRT